LRLNEKSTLGNYHIDESVRELFQEGFEARRQEPCGDFIARGEAGEEAKLGDSADAEAKFFLEAVLVKI
jgi:hypothetical protein